MEYVDDTLLISLSPLKASPAPRRTVKSLSWRKQCIPRPQKDGLSLFLHRYSASKQACYMDLLPDEVLMEIFKYLEGIEVVRLELVCTRWQAILQDESLWEWLLSREFPGFKAVATSSIHPRTHWKKRYVDENATKKKPENMYQNAKRKAERSAPDELVSKCRRVQENSGAASLLSLTDDDLWWRCTLSAR